MAAVYTQRNIPNIGEYNIEAGIYTAVLKFNIAGAGLMGDEMGKAGVNADPTTVPLVYHVDHHGLTSAGAPYAQTVYTYLCAKHIEHTTTAADQIIIATYEGRIIGVHSVFQRTQMISEPIYQGLHVVAGDYPAIGHNFEGTSRDVPALVFVVNECVTLANMNAKVGLATTLAGYVNEAGWVAPWFPTPLGEGAVLYLGCSSVAPDRRTRTAMLTHEFMRVTSRWLQHVYEWFDYVEEPSTTGLGRVRRYDTTPSSAVIQLVAGTDIADEFDDLALTGPLL